MVANFSINKSLEEVYSATLEVEKEDFKYRILAYDDLITNKIKSGRPKDLLDVQELQRIRKGK